MKSQEIAMSDRNKMIEEKDRVNKRDAIKTIVANFLGKDIGASERPRMKL